MKIYNGLKKIPRSLKGAVVTIGVFDGVHRGHQRILKRVVRRARAARVMSVVVTFEPHPARVLAPRREIPFLTTVEHRLRIIEGLGIDACIVLKFDRRFAALSAERFARDVLGARIGAGCVVVGENFLFGSQQAGAARLAKLGEGLGFCVERVGSLKRGGSAVSSSRIRREIEAGRLGSAAGMLGRPVSVFGTVVRGDARGRILGFKTANINPHHEAIPPSGVYVVFVRLSGKLYKGVLNIGRRPTFYGPRGEDEEPLIEAHIFSFNRNIYGKDLEVRFVRKIRKEKRFVDKDRLALQIRRDAKKAMEVLC